MGGSSSREEALYLSGTSSAKPSELQTRMEGGDEVAPLVRAKPIAKAIGTLSELERYVSLANELGLQCAQALGGLVLDFELKSGVTRRDLLEMSFNRVLGAAVVIIRATGGARGLPRVTTPRGFVWLYLALQDIYGAMQLLGKKASLAPREVPEECPICMDRAVEVALACGHAFCKPCQMEWLVGEGRGTCPMCRSQESERNEWLLESVMEREPDESIVLQAECVMGRILRFLSSLPTVAEFAAEFQMPWGGVALWSPVREDEQASPRDVLSGCGLEEACRQK